MVVVVVIPTFRLRATKLAVVMRFNAYRSDVSVPILVSTSFASSVISTSSSSHLSKLGISQRSMPSPAFPFLLASVIPTEY